MMEALSFELSGKNAFFKKPDVNSNVYFTYNHIHRVALLGLLGAIVGYSGYHEQKKDIDMKGDTLQNKFPQFYEKLRHLKISVVPNSERSYFSKKIQVFNNSVGYASGEEGRNLVVKEQWLDHPSWTIYILDDGTDAFLQIKSSILSQKTVYIPYLGKNDHPADLKYPRIVKLNPVTEVAKIDSLFQEGDVLLKGFARGEKNMHFYREYLPVALDEKLNGYLFSKMFCTNRQVKELAEHVNVFLAENKRIIFY